MMLHPSYKELMQKINEESDSDQPIVHSRYSVVMGTSKRARQITAARKTEVKGVQRKALSLAVEEMMEDKVHIVSEASENYESYVADENGRV